MSEKLQRGAASGAVMLSCAGLLLAAAANPIHFSNRQIGFVLENCETSIKYAPETMAGGVAVFDFDNDGDLDVFFTNGADIVSLRKTSEKYWNRLYRNDGKGVFNDVTGSAGVAGAGYDTGVAVADYDNDGYKDIFVGGVHRNTLYHNNGNGAFTDVTAGAGLGEADKDFGPLWSVGGAWLDVNNDGFLDLFVTNYLSWTTEKEPECLQGGKRDYCHPKYFKGTPNRLYLGNGSGKFTDISAASGIRAHIGKGMGAAIADFDRDGLADIFVTNDKLANYLFHNLGNAKFEEMAFKTAVAYAEHGHDISGMGSDFRDMDNDGWPDIVFVALDSETFPFFRNSGKGYFDEATASSGLAPASRTMSGYGPGIYDFDNDGWKDIFVSRGHVQSPLMEGTLVIAQHNTVFRNTGAGKYIALTREAGLEALPKKRHRGSAFGDLDGDGRVDVVVSALSSTAEIWMNNSPDGNHWLELRLQGTASNRDGVGAHIKVTTKLGTQYNHVTSAVGYASSSAGPVHFGLGRADAVDSIEIRWPSGATQRLENVKGDRVLDVREPTAMR